MDEEMDYRSLFEKLGLTREERDFAIQFNIELFAWIQSQYPNFKSRGISTRAITGGLALTLRAWDDWQRQMEEPS